MDNGFIDVGRICEWCATPIVSNDVRVRFCAKKCSLAHWKRLHPRTKNSLGLDRFKRRTKSERAKVLDFYASLKTDPCMDCGLKFDPVCMDFDHRDASSKLFNLAKIVRMSVPLSWVKEEISKCDLVCSNCHRLRTKRRNHARMESNG